MVFYITFVYFGGVNAPKWGQSTNVLENLLKMFTSIKLDKQNPNLHVNSSNYE